MSRSYWDADEKVFVTPVRIVGGGAGAGGKSLEFNWDGTKLGIRQEGEEDFTYVDLKGAKGDQGAPGNDGSPGNDGAPGSEGPPGPPGQDAEPQFTQEQVDALLQLLD